LLYINTTQSQ